MEEQLDAKIGRTRDWRTVVYLTQEMRDALPAFPGQTYRLRRMNSGKSEMRVEPHESGTAHIQKLPARKRDDYTHKLEFNDTTEFHPRYQLAWMLEPVVAYRAAGKQQVTLVMPDPKKLREPKAEKSPRVALVDFETRSSVDLPAIVAEVHAQNAVLEDMLPPPPRRGFLRRLLGL